MLEAILEGAWTLGPTLFLLLLPILIPAFAVGISSIFDRVQARGEST